MVGYSGGNFNRVFLNLFSGSAMDGKVFDIIKFQTTIATKSLT